MRGAAFSISILFSANSFPQEKEVPLFSLTLIRDLSVSPFFFFQDRAFPFFLSFFFDARRQYYRAMAGGFPVVPAFSLTTFLFSLCIV